MLRKNRIVLFVLVILCFISCNKPSNLTGRVFNVYTGEPIANIPILVRSAVANYSGEEPGSKLLGKTESDVNGRFALNISNKRIKKNAIITCNQYQTTNEDSIQEAYMAVKDDGFNNLNLFKNVDLNNEANQFVEFPMAPLSRIKFSFKINGYNIGDSVSVNLLDGNSKIQIFKYFNDGQTANRIFLPSNGKILISLDSWKNGILKQKIDTIHVRPFEKANHLIVFENY